MTDIQSEVRRAVRARQEALSPPDGLLEGAYRIRRRRTTYATATGLAAITALVGAVAISRSVGSDNHDTVAAQSHRQPSADGSEDFLSPRTRPPSGWRTTIAGVRASAKMPVVVPNTPVASESNLDAAYLAPDGRTLFLYFPVPPGQDPSRVRQPEVNVYESVWMGGDPASAFRDNATKAPAAGKSVCTVGSGLTALCVRPNSPDDANAANPAYVEFVLNGVDVQVSGGSDFDTVMSIANDLATRG